MSCDRRPLPQPAPVPHAARRRAAALLAAWLACGVLWGCTPTSSRRGSAPSVEIAAPPPGFDPTAAGAGKTVADAALARLGTPYVYGGTGDSGLDCSGLVYRVYLEHGIKLPRTVRDQVKVGNAVDPPRAGDLVFFRLKRRRTNHVGIYLGGGKFVHASTGREQVVVDDLFDSDYFRERYVGARRIVPVRRDESATAGGGGV